MIFCRQIYDGYSEESGSVLTVAGNNGRTQSGSTVASAFQALVVFSRLIQDSVSALHVQYRADGELTTIKYMDYILIIYIYLKLGMDGVGWKGLRTDGGGKSWMRVGVN